MLASRTYDDEDEGETVREGFEPSKLNPASSSSFAIDNDDDERANVGKMHEESEEAQHWDEGEDQDEGEPSPKAKYGSLDDRHVWNSKDGEDA